eukprot:7701361-Pyramimonas_sp.AAC.1
MGFGSVPFTYSTGGMCRLHFLHQKPASRGVLENEHQTDRACPFELSEPPAWIPQCATGY